MNHKWHVGVLCSLVAMFTATAALAQHGYAWEAGSGKTYDVEIELPPGPPIFRMTSADSLNGRPKYDYFVLVKAKLNGL